MSEIRISARMTCDPQNFDELTQVCERMVANAREHAGVIEYSYWVNSARDALCRREHYEDDDALINHVKNMDHAAHDKLLALAKAESIEVAAKRTRTLDEVLGRASVPVTLYEPLHSV